MKYLLFLISIIFLFSCEKKEIISVKNYTYEASLTLAPVEHNYVDVERHITLKISDTYTGESLKMSYRINNKNTEYLYQNGKKVNNTDVILNTKIDKQFYFTYTATTREDKLLKIILENSSVKKEIELLIPVTDPLFYTVNVQATDGGAINPGGVLSIKEDSVLTLTATPIEYYNFAYWENGYASPERKVKITSDTTLIATFSEYDKFNIVVSSTEGGTATTSADIAYKTEKVTLTATPSEHYDFVKWSDGNTETTREITVTANITLQAIFVPKIYTVSGTVTPEEAGMLIGTGNFAYNTYTKLTTTINPGYLFEDYTINGSNVITDNPYDLKIMGPTSVQANLYKTVESVKLFAPEKILLSKKELQIEASVLPELAKYKALTWRTSNPAVATVDETGNVHLWQAGSCTITATTTDKTNISSSVELRIHDKVYGYIVVERSVHDATERTDKVYFRATRYYDNYLLNLSGSVYTEGALNITSFQKGNIPFTGEIFLGEMTYPIASPEEGLQPPTVSIYVMEITTISSEKLVEIEYDKELNELNIRKE